MSYTPLLARARVIDEVHADTTVINSAAETNLCSLSVPGGAVAAGDQLELWALFDFLNNSGSTVNYDWRLKLGTTTMLDSGAIAVGTSTGRVKALLRAVISVESVTAQRVGATLIGGRGTGNWPTFFNTTPSFLGGGYGTAAEDTSSAKSLIFSIQMGTAAAAADCILHAAVLSIARK